MRILVTGVAGQVGSEMLRRAAHGVVIGTTHADLDITSADAVADAFAMHAPDLVVNAAAYTAVDRAEQEPDVAFAVNRDGAAHVARACAARQIPLIHLSTDYVFSGEGRDRLAEADPTAPVNVYGQSKLEGEHAIRESLAEHVILRTSWVFGATGANFVKTVLRLARERDELQIVNDQTGCPTWAGDLAETILFLVERFAQHDTLPWGTYHYCGTPQATWYAFANAILDRCRANPSVRTPHVAPIATEGYPTPARRPIYTVLSCAKIETAFGIRPPPWGPGLDEVMSNLTDA